MYVEKMWGTKNVNITIPKHESIKWADEMDAQSVLAAKSRVSSESTAGQRYVHFYTQLRAALCKRADVSLLASLFFNLKETCKVVNIYRALECQVQNTEKWGREGQHIACFPCSCLVIICSLISEHTTPCIECKKPLEN